MKIRNVTFILMLGVLILFSMCKKDKIDSPPNTGGGVDPGGNGNTDRPQLVSFSPESGAIGDTISITGTGYFNNITVSFGNTTANVIDVNTSTTNNVKSVVIRVVVPAMPDTSTKISVKVDTTLLTFEKNFTRTSIIQFSGFSPANGFIGDTITLTGAFYKNTPTVRFGDVSARVISKDSKTLKVKVPDDIVNATPAISVVDGQTITSKTSFHLNAPVIDSVYPRTAYVGQVIRIAGKGFRNTFSYDQVYMDNSGISVSSAGNTPTAAPESNTSIAVNTKNAGIGMHGFAVEVAGLKTLAKDSVRLIAPIPPEITSIVEDTIVEGDLIEIMGNHFLSPSPEVPTTVTTVDRGITKNFNIEYISDNEIIVWVPGLTNKQKYNITVTVLTSSVTSATQVTYFDKP